MQNPNQEIMTTPSQHIIDTAKRESHQWLNPETWRTMIMVAETFLKSGAMPKTMDTAPKLMVALQAGKEAGMQPIESINSFYFVNGKIAMYGDLTIAQVLKAGHIINWGECNDKTATVEIVRKDNGSKNKVTFTMQMATERGLNSNPVYKKHPENMLRFKAFHLCAKFIVPDALHGIQIKEIAEAEFEPESPIVMPAVNVAAPEQVGVFTKKPVRSLEEAVAENEIIEEMPVKEEKPARKSGKEVLEENKRMVKARASAWPADVCALVRFLAEVRDEDMPEDMLQLKKDAVSGEFKGYDAYPSIRGMIANMPAADAE